MAVPEDLDDPPLPKARRRVELPFLIRWSGPPITYDLNDRADRARVYEQVLREGSEDDVCFYIVAHQLRDLFDALVLPPSVRQAWASWLVSFSTCKRFAVRRSRTKFASSSDWSSGTL